MIDLETCSTLPTAAFSQIGFCVFDPYDLGETFKEAGNIFVDVQDCMNHGLTVDWDTMRWWSRQSDEARKAMFGDQGDSLREALGILAHFIMEEHNVQYVWSHGASFDIPILHNAYSKFASEPLDVPWAYKQVRDTRTAFDLSSPVWPQGDARCTPKHNAQADAVNQARALSTSLQKLQTF